MPQINRAFIIKIERALEDSVFSKDDFELELPDSGWTLAKVVFKHRRDYWIAISEETKSENVQIKKQFQFETRDEKRSYKAFIIKATPGEYKALDVEEVGGLDEITRRIPDWCKSIRQELYVQAPSADPLADLKAKFEKDIEADVGDPESYFTAEELQSVNEKLEATMDRLTELSEEFSLSQKQLSEIRKEFAEFQRSAAVYPKGVWARITANGMVKTVRQFLNTPEGRDFLLDQVKRLFGGDGT